MNRYEKEADANRQSDKLLQRLPTWPEPHDGARRRAWMYAAVTTCVNAGDDMDYRLRLTLFQWVMLGLSMVTPRELMNVFPPDKLYDGKQYKCKDYYSTMEAVASHGIDTPLGNCPFEFLYNYVNRHIRCFTARYMCAISDARRATGQSGILEEFLAREGVSSYTRFTDGYGRTAYMNNTTGVVQVVQSPRPKPPRWWRIIDGGKKGAAP